MIKNYDKFWIGLLSGMVTPLIIILIYYKVSYGGVSFSYFWDRMSASSLESKLISVATVGNLGVFFLYFWLEADRASKGVVSSMFVFGTIIMYFKYL
ncbi:MAG: hypothetical protein HRT72_07535 [Flavobacteriales bacterium]|nr:hypothetical protein [Flavobacteriales bacterium]